MWSRQRKHRVSLLPALLLPVLMGVWGCGIWEGFEYAIGVKDKCDSGSATSPVPVALLQSRWEARFGPLGGEPWSWDVIPTADFQRICGGVPPDVFGCTIFMGGCPSSFTTSANAHDCRLAAHEFAHAALFRMGIDTDRKHSRADIWKSGGFVDSFAACQ
jgi:hypothetical protein